MVFFFLILFTPASLVAEFLLPCCRLRLRLRLPGYLLPRSVCWPSPPARPPALCLPTRPHPVDLFLYLVLISCFSTGSRSFSSANFSIFSAAALSGQFSTKKQPIPIRRPNWPLAPCQLLLACSPRLHRSPAAVPALPAQYHKLPNNPLAGPGQQECVLFHFIPPFSPCLPAQATPPKQ